MAHRIMKNGLIGMMFGFGLGLAANSESQPISAIATPEAVASCHKRVLESAPNIYGMRELGRSEAWQSGATISGKIQGGADMAFQESIYELRTIGRAEARQIERFMEEGPDEGRDMEILAGLESSRDIYRLRSLGRGEAHGTGTDFCELATTEPSEVSLR